MIRVFFRNLTLLLCLTAPQGLLGQHTCLLPPFLQPGDTVAVLTPSYASAQEGFPKTVDVLRAWGYECLLGRHTGSLHAGAYAGTADQRADDLMKALANPSVKAIICQRGGYGTIQLIGRVPLKAFSDHPKWLVGYSDITTLHSMSVCAGVVSVHGPIGYDLAATEGQSEDCLLLRDLLSGKVPEYRIPHHRNNIPGRGKGRLVGGNLSTFAVLAASGADFTDTEEDLILFIEEVEENYHAIDRYFQMLLLRGVLDHTKGVILGSFTDCKRDLAYDSVEHMLSTYLLGRGIPVCCGFPAGHGGRNAPLLMGAEVTLDVHGTGSVLQFNL